MPQPILDGQVGVRLELATLATLAQYYYDKHELAALKSASTLVRCALNDLVSAVVQFEHADVVSASDAIGVLEDLGVFPRVSHGAHLRNVQEETIASEPHSRLKQWDSTRRARGVQGKLHINVGDSAAIEREIAQALQNPILQAAIARNSTTSEPDEGEFSVEVARAELRQKLEEQKNANSTL